MRQRAPVSYKAGDMNQAKTSWLVRAPPTLHPEGKAFPPEPPPPRRRPTSARPDLTEPPRIDLAD